MGLLRSASFRLSSRKSSARRSSKSFSPACSVASSAESLTAEELNSLKQNSKLASEARPPTPHTTRGLSPGQQCHCLATALHIPYGPRPLLVSPTNAIVPTTCPRSHSPTFPLQAEALKREVDALKSVLLLRGPQAQDGANAIYLSSNELEQLDSSAASPSSPGSPPQAFPAASQQRPPQVKVGALARVMSFGRKKPSPRASPVVSTLRK